MGGELLLWSRSRGALPGKAAQELDGLQPGFWFSVFSLVAWSVMPSVTPWAKMATVMRLVGHDSEVIIGSRGYDGSGWARQQACTLAAAAVMAVASHDGAVHTSSHGYDGSRRTRQQSARWQPQL